MIAAVLFGAGLYGLALCVVLPGRHVAAAGAIACSAGIAVACLLAVVMARRGSDKASAWTALAAGTTAGALVIALGGGLATPLSLLSIALPAEAGRIFESRKARQAGVIAACLALGGSALLQFAIAGAAQPHALLWLPAAAWGAAFYARFRFEAAARGQGGCLACSSDTDAVVFRFEPGGEVVDISGPSHALLGLAPELLLANAFFDRLHVADRVVFLCALADLRHGATRRRVELRLRQPRLAPSSHDVFGSFALDLARTGEAASFFTGILRDDRELRDLRGRLEAAARANEQAEADRAGMLATLGHELRTPLNAIVGFAGMLGQERFGGFQDARQKEYAELIQKCSEHLLAVIESILDVGKARSGARKVAMDVFRLSEAVEVCRSMLALQAGAKGVMVLSEVPPDCEPVTADRRIVQQIIVNLLSNAVKFTAPGGRVLIKAGRAGARLEITVSDTGIGIDDDDLRRLGVPFARLRRSGAEDREGSGLGLFLVKELVGVHGGAFSMESTPGVGTVATVSLPAAITPQNAQGGREAAAVVALSSERKRHGAQRRTA